jgi:histidinol-phosphate aminotransferase
MSCDFYALATPGVRSLHPYEPGKPASTLQRELGLDDIIKLASNENALGPSPAALNAAAQVVAEIHRYPDGNGFELKAALAKRHNVDDSQITLGNGSNDVLEFVIRAFATDQHEVVFSEHAFAVYPLVTQSVGATCVAVPAHQYGHDLEAMAAAVTERTRVLFVANPNNPTGTWCNSQDLRDFIEKLPPHVIVVVDQAYAEYVANPEYPDCMNWINDHENMVVTQTFSKAFGLAGLRVGYMVAHKQITELLNRVRQPFNVNSLALAAARAALEDQEHLQLSRNMNDAGLAYLSSEFTRLGLDYIPSVGNFICVALPRPGREIFTQLLHKGVIVRPIDGYGLPMHLRVTIGLESENQRFIQALGEIL